MGSSKEAARVLNVYCQILKAVDKHIGKDGGKSHFREYVIDEFRKNKSLSDEAAARDKLKLACDYAFLLNSVHHHKNPRSVCKGLRPFALSRNCYSHIT